ncbi:hypothetical protein D915_010581 [Fasciola hepatica]|uniref:Uncharacterized protein n=1 Tax=Fasciola hepatica TaxID=6192 RepID=A0A4E0QZF0_FASHE|nr:hypothetical protein D915_010581 [Fasciola hepatica]
MFLCCPHRRGFSSVTPTGAFDSKVSPTRQWGVNLARERDRGTPKGTSFGLLRETWLLHAFCLVVVGASISILFSDSVLSPMHPVEQAERRRGCPALVNNSCPMKCD